MTTPQPYNFDEIRTAAEVLTKLREQDQHANAREMHEALEAVGLESPERWHATVVQQVTERDETVHAGHKLAHDAAKLKSAVHDLERNAKVDDEMRVAVASVVGVDVKAHMSRRNGDALVQALRAKFAELKGEAARIEAQRKEAVDALEECRKDLAKCRTRMLKTTAAFTDARPPEGFVNPHHGQGPGFAVNETATAELRRQLAESAALSAAKTDDDTEGE